jgi:hypothetical protein
MPTGRMEKEEPIKKEKKKESGDIKYFTISTDNTDYPQEWFCMRTLW